MIRANIRAIFKSTTQTKISPIWYLYNQTPTWQEEVNFQWDDDKVHIVLDQHAELDFNSASSPKQQSADRHVAPLRHIILIPSQPVFAPCHLQEYNTN
jgi:hypothetical protein